ncbi:hypothetical protein [Cutibacterium phage PAVL21]|nr:hypothetical protein [Cutibacterium phage PAVL21]
MGKQNSLPWTQPVLYGTRTETPHPGMLHESQPCSPDYSNRQSGALQECISPHTTTKHHNQH